MNKTPETDEAQHEGLLRGNPIPTQVVHVNFARKLEHSRDEWAAMCGGYKQERDEAKELLVSEKITRNHIIKRSVEVERERDEAIDKYQSLQKTFEEWQLKFLSEQAELLHNKDVERDKLFDEAYQIRIERDELESALRRLLNADIPRPLGGIIDDDERKAAIEWNAFERGEARQHAKAILQQNKEEEK